MARCRASDGKHVFLMGQDSGCVQAIKSSFGGVYVVGGCMTQFAWINVSLCYNLTQATTYHLTFRSKP